MKKLPNPCDCPRLHIWTDGQVFGRSGEWDGFYTVVIDDGDPSPFGPGALHAYQSIGNKTVNECEYRGVIAALEWARAGSTPVHIITDSDLIRGHLRDGYRCAEHLRVYKDRVQELVTETGARVDWMGRDFNKAGWYNAGVLLLRAKTKRQREKDEGVQRVVRKRSKPVVGAPKRWAFKAREEDGL